MKNKLLITVLLASIATASQALWVTIGYTTYAGIESLPLIETSQDGYQWQAATIQRDPADSSTLNTLAYDETDKKWAAVGLDLSANIASIFASPDAQTWVTVTPPEKAFVELKGVAYGFSEGKKTWVAVGQYQSSGVPDVIVSDDALHWTPVSLQLPPGMKLAIFGNVTYANGLWVAVGYSIYNSRESGVIATSTNGTDWKFELPPAGTVWPTFYSAAYANNQWALVGDDTVGDQAIAISNDAVNWKITKLHAACFLDNIAAGQDLQGNPEWMAMGEGVPVTAGSCMYVSSDGINWTRTKAGTAGSVGDLYSLAYGDGKWIAVGNLGSAVISQDNGDTWNNVPLPVPGSGAPVMSRIIYVADQS